MNKKEKSDGSIIKASRWPGSVIYGNQQNSNKVYPGKCSFVRAYTASNGDIEIIRSKVPDEFLVEFNSWVDKIHERVSQIKTLANLAFEVAPKEDRKTFAIWVKDNYPELSGYLFSLLDGRNIEPLIYKNGFTDIDEDM